MKNTWKPTVAGILDIFAGIIIIFLDWLCLSYIESCEGGVGSGDLLSGTFILVLALLAVYGGVYTLKRKKWGWALTGSICAVIGFLGLITYLDARSYRPFSLPLIFYAPDVLFIPAIILTALSKNEFERKTSR